MAYDRTAPRKPKERVRITKTFVEDTALNPGLYVDEKVTGFQLKVTDAGNKVYRVYGKVKGHKTAVTVTIGHHDQPKPVIGPDGQPVIGDDGKPKVDGKWTAEKAEKEAERIRGLMTGGINPIEVAKDRVTASQEKRAKEQSQKKIKAITLRMAFDDYIKAKTPAEAEDKPGARKKKKKQIKPSTAKVYRYDFEKCLADWLDKPLVSISEKNIEDRHESISKDHPGQANHVMRILRAVFYFAMDKYTSEGEQPEPIVKNNPVRKFSKDGGWNDLKPREGFIDDHHLKAFFEACRWLEHPIASDYLPFLLLTGLRAEEAASLPWKQVDFKSRTIHIIETKNGEQHWLPLTDYLHALLKARWQTRKGAYVFGGEGDSHMSDYRWQVERVVERCRYVIASSDDEEIRIGADSFDFIPHDLRRTFGTVAARFQADYIVKALLNHKDKNDVTQTHYFKADLEKLRKPMQEVGDFILNHAEVTEYGAPAAPDASKVVKFQKMDKKPAKA